MAGLCNQKNVSCGESSYHVRQIWGFPHLQGRTSMETPKLQDMQTRINNIFCREFHATGINCARDYYEILGLSRGATQSEIKKAYYALAKLHHPDMNKGDTDSEKRFQEIQKAYEVLKDDEKRAIYDQVGPDAYEQAGSGGGGGPGYDDGGFGFPFSDLNEMWGQFAKGNFDFETSENVEVPFQLSFMESVKGCTKTIQFNASIRCSSCKGIGFPPGAKPQVCKACKGRGSTSFNRGFLSIETTCSTCGGDGRVVKENCKPCKGAGTVPKLKEVEVDFRPGVKNGEVIRLTGEGGAGPRGHAPGDLFVKLEVLPDPVFRRQGLDIHVDSSISFTQAILGGTVQVPTLTGHAVLKVLPGTQPGQKLCLRGKGIKPPHKVPGNQVVNIRIEMPMNLTRRQRLIIEELAKEESEVETPAAAATG
ncbi:hypothetical protein GOP47_0026735 [Adiantum capillus-veneris]|nr:hypothetical protein GOP47_0026735 [Adiantum capillus-veneris]